MIEHPLRSNPDGPARDTIQQMSSPLRPIVVGTAGHIDHGKSRLVLALTGTDPDRLPEEKARGMTIDLGFAHARAGNVDIYFVDVPGHERFIRNMVAGATGIDLALLVVAADDSIMPQTREHAEVISLLEVPRCAIVITKVDLVDDAWASQVESEAREMLAGLGIEPVACVRTSAQTGRGVDELRQFLASQARQLGQTDAIDWFRMPIDRVFTIRGRGTVVTGTASHGVIAINDELELWPVGMDKGVASGFAARRRNAALRLVSMRPKPIRVRGLQTHNETRTNSVGRTRLAVNVAPLEISESARGCELATPGCLTPTLCADVWLRSMRSRSNRRGSPIRTRFHSGTAEVLARARLAAPLSDDGATYRGFAQVRFEVPLTVAYGQHFILRDESGSRTLGGGIVLRCSARPWRIREDAASAEPHGIDAELRRLRDGGPIERVEEVIRGMSWNVGSEKQIACQAGIPIARADAIREELCRLGRVVRLRVGVRDEFVHAELLDETADDVATRLVAHVSRNTRAAGVARGEWPGWMPRACPVRLRGAVGEWIIASGRVVLVGGFVLPRGYKAAFSIEDQSLMDAMLSEYFDAAFQPPSFEKLRCRTDENARRLVELQTLAAARGRLVRIAADVFLHVDRHQEMVARVTEEIRRRGAVTVSDVRTKLDSTRKYVVPFVEHLDSIGVTRRKGDVRVLGPKAPLSSPSDVEPGAAPNLTGGRA